MKGSAYPRPPLNPSRRAQSAIPAAIRLAAASPYNFLRPDRWQGARPFTFGKPK
jgi:hypothetical protein